MNVLDNNNNANDSLFLPKFKVITEQILESEILDGVATFQMPREATPIAFRPSIFAGTFAIDFIIPADCDREDVADFTIVFALPQATFDGKIQKHLGCVKFSSANRIECYTHAFWIGDA